MSLTLVAIGGSLAGATLPLAEGEISVGRDVSNQIALADQSVAPRHCVFACTGGGVTIRDLDLQNPTFVNGLPSGQRPAGDGDRIQIGDSLFVLRQTEDAAGRASPSVRITQELGSPRTPIVRRREDLFAEARLDAGASPARLARDLAALIRITAAINAVRGLVALERPLLELVADVLPATRGAVVLSGRGNEIVSSVGWARGETGAQAVQVNRTAVDRVLRELVGILSFERREDGLAGPASSSRDRSVVAAPLVAFDKLLGAIVLETEAPHEQFDEGHLLLLMAIAGTAATALAHYKLKSTSITTWSARAHRCAKSTGALRASRRPIRRC